MAQKKMQSKTIAYYSLLSEWAALHPDDLHGHNGHLVAAELGDALLPKRAFEELLQEIKSDFFKFYNL
jgi:hypothetical protein